jgi:hypothetical protein
LVARAELTPHDRREMCSLLDRFFLGVDPVGFADDLADKHHALLLHDESGKLCGFTTLALLPSPGGERGDWVLYSGDTIVDSDHRSSAALAVSWIDAVLRLRAEQGIDKLTWLLLCSGLRTYRFLPLFFREFWPRPEAPTPPAARREMDRLATSRYGAAYDSATGVVVLPRPQPLRTECADRGRPRTSAEATFFGERNPGHLRGDELVCLCLIDETNLTAAGRRMVASGQRQRATNLSLPGTTA